MQAMLRALNEFKKENPLVDDCVDCHQDAAGNLLFLRITMPRLALYGRFIDRLAKNLLPTPTPALLKKHETNQFQYFAAKPLSITPKPTHKNILSIQEEIEQNEEKCTQVASTC